MDFLLLFSESPNSFDLKDRLEEVWGLREGFPLKPDPTSLMSILEAHGVTPSECVVVGDASPDLDLARAAGRGFPCGVTWGMTEPGTWQVDPEDWVIDRMEDILPCWRRPTGPRTWSLPGSPRMDCATPCAMPQ